MATVVGTVPGDWGYLEGEDYVAWCDRTKRMYEALEKTAEQVDPAGSLVGAFVHFPFADGCATYVVKKERPLQLLHVPYMDGYQASAITIRGLRVSDVRRQLM